MKPLRATCSLCPKCHKIIDASVVDERGKIWLKKSCKEHGDFKELYWGDAEMYRWVEKYASLGNGVTNPAIKIEPSKVACPYNCGICTAHKSHTVLANMFVTNRCNKRCWYCFAGVDAIRKNGYVYEPSFEEVRGMLQTLLDERPIPALGIQFTGGEPLLRDDLLDIVKESVKMGFKYIQLNTNGILFALDPELPKKYRQAGVSILYLSFDGTTEKTNPKNHRYIPQIIENCRKAGLPIILVPTLINGVNDHEIWPIVKFAFDNVDIVSNVNFQPVSFVGTMASSLTAENIRKKQRITIPDVVRKLEEQSNGMIPKSIFYPVPVILPFLRVVSKAMGLPVHEPTCNTHCGVASYVFKDGDKLIPATDFMNVDALMSLLNEISGKKLDSAMGKAKAAAMLYKNIHKVFNKDKAPANFDLTTALFDLISKKKDPFKRFRENSVMIGMMHFMDPYNYDVDRVQSCVIHYVVPDGRIIPFCAFNALPELYREAINKKFGIPIAEWEKRTGKKLEDDLKRV